MTKSKHLTAADRRVVEILLKRHCTKFEIAKELGVHPSTVGREVNIRKTPAGYFADVAQIDYDTKRKKCGKIAKLSDSKTQTYVLDKLKIGWSPDEIRGRISRQDDPQTFGLIAVCNETIYNWIYSNPYCKRENMYQYLKQGKKHRTKHFGRKSHKQLIPNKVSIHQRPAVVSNRTEFGHWEGDSVVYANKQAINTLNELYAGIVVFTKLNNKTADLTAKAMSTALSNFTAKTLTLDNGCEFVNHELVSKNVGVKIFFCDPYSSYQRGSNENTNGLLRRYLPKKANIESLSQEDLDDIAWELNSRPRKRLKYMSPIEFYEKYVLNLSQKVNVAFESRI
jgi:transposase, IS30 family